MGRVIGPWGVRGWIKVAPYGDGPDGLVKQRAWWWQDLQGRWTRSEVGEARAHSGTVIASLAGIETPEAAAAFKGRVVGVPRASLPKARKGEVYLADLVGLDVVNASGVPLGRVVAIEDFGAHPLLRVAADGTGAGRLVPCVAPILRAIDLEARRIEVEWEPEY